MPQMPAHTLQSQFMPRNLSGQHPSQPGGNPLNDLSAAYAAAAAAAAASGYPGPFNSSQQQGEGSNPALAMFSQFQNGGPVDPRAAGFMNGMAPGNPLAAAQAAAAYAQYCNDPVAAQIMAGGSFPYSPQASHIQPPSGANSSASAYQNLMMNMPGSNVSPGNQISASHNNDQSGNGSTRRKNATRETTATLKAWLYEHRKNPYPTKGEKIMLAIITKMSLNQVSTWFANARRRLKKENKMTFSPRNRTAEDIDSDDEQTSGKKNGKKNGSTSSDNMNFDDLDDLDDINDEELEGENDEDNEDNDSFSYNSENKPSNKQNPHQPLANNNNTQNMIQKHGMPGMQHHPHHGHHPYFNSQQLQLQQQALQQQQHAQYLQSLFPQHAGQIDANKMMSMMLNSSGMFANQAPLASSENKNHTQAAMNATGGLNGKNPASLFMPPIAIKPNQSPTCANGNKSASSKPKIWSLADVATNTNGKSQNNTNKSLNNSLSSLSSSSLSSSSSSSNSSTNNYYAPVSPALKQGTNSPHNSTNLSQPLNINASNTMTPTSSTSAPLSSSSSSQQNQSPKSTSSSSNSEQPQQQNKYGLMSQQHQQLLSFFAAAAASQSDSSQAQPNFHQMYLQQLTSQMHGANPFNGSFLTQGLIQQMAKQQQEALQKSLDASNSNDSTTDEENLDGSAEANKSVEGEKTTEADEAEESPKVSKSLKHKLENDDDEDEDEEEVAVKRQKTTKKPKSFTMNNNVKLFKTISSTGSEADTANSDNEHEDDDGEVVDGASCDGNKSFDSLASNEQKKGGSRTSQVAGLLLKQQQSNTTSKQPTTAVAANVTSNKGSLE